MEEGLFPHSRAITNAGDTDASMEEERRLCYVAMTRAEKRLYLSWARYRRRFGGGQPEPSIRSRFLQEVPPALIEKARGQSGQVDLYAEQNLVRETARKNLYTGKTYNSVENIRQFFAEKGGAQAPAQQSVPPRIAPPAAQKPLPMARKKTGLGSTIEHVKYGRGTIVRLEGSGEDAKVTVSFPGYGLKKLIAKYAGIKIE
jgi:DNA helicase-2/ATP-dependent DNA helicase PcrA